MSANIMDDCQIGNSESFATSDWSSVSEKSLFANVAPPATAAKVGPVSRQRWRVVNIASLAVLSLAIVGCVAFVARHCSLPKVFIALTVNATGIADCPLGQSNWSVQHPLPCMTADGLMMTSDKPLAPLVCKASEANCGPDQFQLTPGRDGVIIWEDGVYRVHSRVTFLESDPAAYATSTVRVDSSGRAGADGDPGIWLDCASHSAHAEAANPFTDCTLDGVRRLSRGDIVSFQVRSPFRRVNLHGGATQFFVYRL